MLIAVIGLLTFTASPAKRQPFAPGVLPAGSVVPLAQPAKERSEPVDTSESQVNDPEVQPKFVPPTADGSLLKMMELMVAVTVPVDPVSSVPTTADDAGIARKRAQLNPTVGIIVRKILFTCFLSSNF